MRAECVLFQCLQWQRSYSWTLDWLTHLALQLARGDLNLSLLRLLPANDRDQQVMVCVQSMWWLTVCFLIPFPSLVL